MLMKQEDVIYTDILDSNTNKTIKVKFYEKDFETWFFRNGERYLPLLEISISDFEKVKEMIKNKRYRTEKNDAFNLFAQFFGIKLMLARIGVF